MPVTPPVNGCVSGVFLNAAVHGKMFAGTIAKYSNDLKRR